MISKGNVWEMKLTCIKSHLELFLIQRQILEELENVVKQCTDHWNVHYRDNSQHSSWKYTAVLTKLFFFLTFTCRLSEETVTSCPVCLSRFSSWDTTTCPSCVRWQSNSNISVPCSSALEMGKTLVAMLPSVWCFFFSFFFFFFASYKCINNVFFVCQQMQIQQFLRYFYVQSF